MADWLLCTANQLGWNLLVDEKTVPTNTTISTKKLLFCCKPTIQVPCLLVISYLYFLYWVSCCFPFVLHHHFCVLTHDAFMMISFHSVTSCILWHLNVTTAKLVTKFWQVVIIKAADSCTCRLHMCLELCEWPCNGIMYKVFIALYILPMLPCLCNKITMVNLTA